jgi:hypothetical protein
MADRFAVAELCAARVADSYEAQQILIEFCIAETAVHCAWVRAEEVRQGLLVICGNKRFTVFSFFFPFI